MLNSLCSSEAKVIPENNKVVLKHVECLSVSYMHAGNTNIGPTPTRLSRLYMQPSSTLLPHVIIINILHSFVS